MSFLSEKFNLFLAKLLESYVPYNKGLTDAININYLRKDLIWSVYSPVVHTYSCDFAIVATAKDAAQLEVDFARMMNLPEQLVSLNAISDVLVADMGIFTLRVTIPYRDRVEVRRALKSNQKEIRELIEENSVPIFINEFFGERKASVFLDTLFEADKSGHIVPFWERIAKSATVMSEQKAEITRIWREKLAKPKEENQERGQTPGRN